MSKILVVEPYRMLQQAIALSLFPDHEVKIAEGLPNSDADAVKDYDVVVIDAAALRENSSLAPQTARTVQSWPVPIIWLESEEESSVPVREKLVVLRRPIAREPLFAALAECLGRPAAKSNGKPTETNKSNAQAPVPTGTSAGGQDPKVIELVDVVEETPPQQRTRNRQTRSKK
jgi:hypothetical protein